MFPECKINVSAMQSGESKGQLPCTASTIRRIPFSNAQHDWQPLERGQRERPPHFSLSLAPSHTPLVPVSSACLAERHFGLVHKPSRLAFGSNLQFESEYRFIGGVGHSRTPIRVSFSRGDSMWRVFERYLSVSQYLPVSQYPPPRSRSGFVG